MKAELLSHTPFEGIREALGEGTLPMPDALQHLSFTFAVEGISRACSHQLVRHRVASYSQQSQRHIESRRLQKHVVVPPTIQGKAPEAFEEFISHVSKAYRMLVERGIPREDARFVLPNAATTGLLVTMDGRELLHFFGLRCCRRSQWELRELADAMLGLVRIAQPDLFKAAGPYCYQLGHCPEGRHSCGEVEEVKKKYAPT